MSDPSGNSFVENPHAPRSDPHRDISHFLRSREQDHALGLYTAEEIEAAPASGNLMNNGGGGSTEAISEDGGHGGMAVTPTAAAASTVAPIEVLHAPTASAEDSTSSTTSSTLLLRCQVKNFLNV